jgi:glutathione synthase/RimK-type ligase-like ATP-grasp enzyme
MRNILVITSDPDPHVDAVKELLPDGCKILTLDPMRFSDIPPVILTPTQLGNNGRFSNIQLEDIDIVWYRKPRYLDIGRYPVDLEYQKYVDASIREMVQSLMYSLSEALWVSDYWNIKRGNNKLVQLKLAKKLGFSTLDTLITSDAAVAREFINRYNKRVVTKPLSWGYAFNPENEDYYEYFYATSLRDIPMKEIIDELSNLSYAPAIFQQEVVEGIDIRATIIGTQIYTCEIHKQKHSRTDWREYITTDELQFKTHTLPEEIYCKCIDMLDHMGLKFGVIEFKLDPKGNYWFMEINPNGQWLFVQDKCPELNIAQGIADFFLR